MSQFLFWLFLVAFQVMRAQNFYSCCDDSFSLLDCCDQITQFDRFQLRRPVYPSDAYPNYDCFPNFTAKNSLYRDCLTTCNNTIPTANRTRFCKLATNDYGYIIFIVWIIEAGVLVALFLGGTISMFVKNVLTPMAITFIESRKPIYNIRQDLLADRTHARTLLRTINFLRLSGLAESYQSYLERRKGVVSQSLAMVRQLWSTSHSQKALRQSRRRDGKRGSTKGVRAKERHVRDEKDDTCDDGELRAGHYKVKFLDTVALEAEPCADLAIELEEVRHDRSDASQPGRSRKSVLELDEAENYLLYLPSEVMVIILSYVLGCDEIDGASVASIYEYATRHRAIEEYDDATIFFNYFRLNTEFVQQLEGKSLADGGGGFFPPVEGMMVDLESSASTSSSGSASDESEI